MSKLIRSFFKSGGRRPRLFLPAVAGLAVLMLAGCAGPAYLNGGYSGYTGSYYNNGYPGPYTGPYYGDYGPYTDIAIGGGGYYGGHHFFGNSFGHGGGHGGGGHGGGHGR
jgi:hypothetical protein